MIKNENKLPSLSFLLFRQPQTEAHIFYILAYSDTARRRRIANQPYILVFVTADQVTGIV